MAGKKFTSDYQPNHDRKKKCGRKKSIWGEVKHWLKIEYDFVPSQDDLSKIVWGLLWKTLPELKEIKNDDNTPAFVHGVISGVAGSIQRKDFKTIDTLLDRVKGRPAQTTTVKQETINHNFDYEKLSDAELESLQEILQKANTGE